MNKIASESADGHDSTIPGMETGLVATEAPAEAPIEAPAAADADEHIPSGDRVHWETGDLSEDGIPKIRRHTHIRV